MAVGLAESTSRDEHASRDEPASRATFRTIGGTLLIAFFAASIGFYIHTTSASSDDSPRSMMPGYVVDSPAQVISMNQDGVGSYAPADSVALNKQQRRASTVTAPLRGTIQHAATFRHPQQSLVNRRLNPAAAKKYNPEEKAAQQLRAHQRLSDHSSHTSTQDAAVLPANHKAGQLPSASRAVATSSAVQAVHQMEDRIATDLVKAFKCTIGTDCLEHNLIDAEKAADKLFYKSSASNAQHKKAASVLHNMGAKVKNPKNAVRSPSTIFGPASSNNFWKEAAEIAEKGPEHPARKPKNSAKTFVKQLVAAAHEAKLAKAEEHVVPVSSRGPLTSSKSKTFP